MNRLMTRREQKKNRPNKFVIDCAVDNQTGLIAK